MLLPFHIRTALETSPSPRVWPRLDKTASFQLVATMTGSVCTNKGASGSVTFTLPNAPFPGCGFLFMVRAAQALVVAPQADGALIVNGAKQTDGVTMTADDEGEWLFALYDGDNDWLCSVGGTWS